MIAGGGGGGLTIEEPENNIVRAAYYALASALSGTQTMALCCYDEAYTIPSEKASLIALRTMQILQEEVGVCDTVDPLAGSYYLEWLTNEMEKRIVAEMRRIEDLGGIVKCIENGYIQKLISLQAYEEEKAVRSGKIPKVAVNRYVAEQEPRAESREPRGVSPEVKLHQFRPEVQEEQIKRLADVKAGRDKDKVDKCLAVLREKAAGTENLMPYILDCVRAYCTVGEMTKVFKSIFGEFKEPIEL
jgi:methylmalonyl-CoA mutase N-terminal domain/subunit